MAKTRKLLDAANPEERDAAGTPLPVTHGRLMDFPENPIACMRRQQAEHGNISALEQDSQRLIFAFGPEYNQPVLSDAATYHSRFFSIRGPRNSPQRRLTSGLLSMNGQEHKLHRRMVMGPFQKKTIETYHDAICEFTHELLDDWAVPKQNGLSVASDSPASPDMPNVRDMHTEMTQYMLRVTSGLLFGLDMPEMAYRIGGMIDRWVDMNHSLGIGAFVSDRAFTEGYDRLLSLAEELETDIRAMIHARRTSARPGNDVLSLLIRAHEQEGLVNDDELVGHAALLFSAAHLTTAHTMTWTLFLLAQHPSVMPTVLEEIEATIRGTAPTQANIGGMPVFERVLKESMRVLPASAYSQRIAAEPTQLGPFHLPRGTPIVFSQFMTHHLPELYADPETFRPDRWLTLTPPPYAYIPFGGGSRMCLGGPLAMMTLKTALPMIVKRYRLTVVPGSEISGMVVSTMLGPTTKIPMSVVPQDGRFEASAVTGNIHSMMHLHEAPAAGTASRRRAA